MFWVNKIVDELEKQHHDGEIVVSSGVSPSGTYHLGTLREVLTAEALAREVKRRGGKARHIHVVDDLDIFRKLPVGVPEKWEEYLGMPLCDVPSPDGDGSYADYYFKDMLEAAKALKLDIEVMRSHEKYRAGFFVPAVEKALTHTKDIKDVLERVSGRQLEDSWTPIQVLEGGYLKNRVFKSIDTDKKEVIYVDKDGKNQTVSYAKGEVKLAWRIDWAARWWLLGVNAEPFGRDHATKGGSYDTGEQIVKVVYDTAAPYPIPYNFINRTGDTKKMSKSKGDTITAAELLKMLPAEVVWYFVIRYAPDKLLFFDQGPTLMRLIDEFSELLAKQNKTEDDQQLIDICTEGIKEPTISHIPFTLLVASYQAALKDPSKTIEVIKREPKYSKVAEEQEQIITAELTFIDEWLKVSAPDDVKFEIVETVDESKFSDVQRDYLRQLAAKIEAAPSDADGEWFHLAVYEFKDKLDLPPKELFSTLYQALIGKDAGPRAGWFLSLLPRDWLIKRLKLNG